MTNILHLKQAQLQWLRNLFNRNNVNNFMLSVADLERVSNRMIEIRSPLSRKVYNDFELMINNVSRNLINISDYLSEEQRVEVRRVLRDAHSILNSKIVSHGSIIGKFKRNGTVTR